MIALRLLGSVEVTVDGAPPPAELLWKKNLALLAYLALSPRHTRSREHLTGLLWGASQESAARHSLNEALRVLRRALGEGAIHTDPISIRIEPGAVALDLDAFAACETAKDWAAAAALVDGTLMEGFAVPGESGFEDWLTAERTQWERRAVTALVEAADLALSSGATLESVRLGERAHAMLPTSGAAINVLLRALTIAGDRAAALQRFEGHKHSLEERLGVEPDVTVSGLVDRIRNGRLGPAPESLEARVALTRRLPLAGRADAMERLSKSWRRCVGGRQTEVTVVLADAGLGKTRLAEEVESRVSLDGGAVLTVRGVEADRASPWSGLLALGRSGLLGTAGIAGAPAEAHAAFAAHIPEWADKFRGAADVEPAPLPRAFTELVRAAVEEQPMLIVVDDCHHLDPESLQSLAALPRDLPDAPVLLLFTAEPTTPCETLDALRTLLRRDIPGDAIELEPLDEAALRAMAAAVFPNYVAEAVDRLTRRVAADSAGVPLLAVEILHAVSSGLDLLQESGTWPKPFHTLTETTPGELPDTVVAAVRIGYRRLSGPAQQALAAAAALGGRVTPEHLGRATELPASGLRAALDELEWQRWLTSDARGYGFVAGVVKRIIERDMLTPGQRRRIRAAVLPSPA